MSTNLKLLNQNNKKIYGGGNVKQGLVPSGTKFYGMRLKTNLNRARNGSGNACKAYDGVCFEQFDRSVNCIVRPTATITGGTVTTRGGYKYHTFSASGTYNLTVLLGNCSTKTYLPSFEVEYLIVGGGGKGGKADHVTAGIVDAAFAGGGGGGGVVEGSISLGSGSFIVTVGAGGDTVTTDPVSGTGASGVSSAFITLIGKGGVGGRGCKDDSSASPPSGDGGISGVPTSTTGGSPVSGQSGGGGGGAQSAGGSGSGATGGKGGQSYSLAGSSWNPINNDVPNYGYGGGGGGGVTGGGGGAGSGIGGGSGGAVNTDGNAAATFSAASIFAGGGGGGGAALADGASSTGGDGATGIVIIRYPA